MVLPHPVHDYAARVSKTRPVWACHAAGVRYGDKFGRSIKAFFLSGLLKEMAHIHRADRLGNYDEVATALAQGADVNAASIHHFTPLMLAAREGHLRIVELLLGNGANPNRSHPNGRTILHLAASAGHEQIVRILLASGANADATSKRGDTPAIEAAHFNRLGVVETLQQAQANPSHQDKKGRTAQDWLKLGRVPGEFRRTFGERMKG